MIRSRASVLFSCEDCAAPIELELVVGRRMRGQECPGCGKRYQCALALPDDPMIATFNTVCDTEYSTDPCGDKVEGSPDLAFAYKACND